MEENKSPDMNSDKDETIDIEDFIYEHLEEDDLFFQLSDLLDELSVTRENAEALLDAIHTFDIYELYQALADNFRSLLTDEEYSEIKRKYRKTFDVEMLGDLD